MVRTGNCRERAGSAGLDSLGQTETSHQKAEAASTSAGGESEGGRRARDGWRLYTAGLLDGSQVSLRVTGEQAGQERPEDSTLPTMQLSL